MSHEDDYANNIDDQLLTAVKDQVRNHHGLDDPRVEDIASAAALSEKDRQLDHHHHQQLHYQGDDEEFNIQIPEPLVDSKSKIYPVTENTITAEGNLITRPFPEQEFLSREELNDFIQEFARDNGFGVVIAHSNKKAIYYTCELGGRYRHKKAKKDDTPDPAYMMDPNTKTKKLRCPFSMTASFKKLAPKWYLRTTCNEHNHPQLDPLSNHPMLRKRSDELNLLILDLYKVGTKPSHIEKKIKEQFPDVLIKREDIYNEIRGYKRKLKKQHRFVNQVPNVQMQGQRRGLVPGVGYQQVLDGSDAHDVTQRAIEMEIERQQQEELQRQLQLHQHNPHHHIDEQQLQHYQQQLQEHGIDDPNDNDSTAAAAIAAVANQGDLSMDNIDSRLVGE